MLKPHRNKVKKKKKEIEKFRKNKTGKRSVVQTRLTSSLDQLCWSHTQTHNGIQTISLWPGLTRHHCQTTDPGLQVCGQVCGHWSRLDISTLLKEDVENTSCAVCSRTINPPTYDYVGATFILLWLRHAAAPERCRVNCRAQGCLYVTPQPQHWFTTHSCTLLAACC